MRSDTLMAGTLVAFSADGATDGNHSEGGETNAIGTQQYHLKNISAGFHSAVAPDFNAIANSRFHQGAMRLHYADLNRQPNVLDGMFARGAGWRHRNRTG